MPLMHLQRLAHRSSEKPLRTTRLLPCRPAHWQPLLWLWALLAMGSTSCTNNDHIVTAAAEVRSSSRSDSTSNFISPPPMMLAEPGDALATAVIATEHDDDETTEAMGVTYDIDSSGHATISVPLWVPEGRNGLEPELSLEYSSTLANGSVGVGWSLSGIGGGITRCGRDIRRDGDYKQLIFNASWFHVSPTDYLCLGGQRLIAVNGHYGSHGTEYRTESETFTKIVSNSAGPDVNAPIASFTAWTKDGRVLRYAQEEWGPRVEVTTAHGELTNTGNVVRSWRLQTVSDRFGNSMEIAYEGDVGRTAFAPVELLPKSIAYGGHPGQSHTRRVDFIYGDRGDATELFDGGFWSKRSKRLRRIEMHGPNPTNLELLRSYRLSYDEGPLATASQLRWITECDQFDVCKHPLHFEWSEEYDYRTRDHRGADFDDPSYLGTTANFGDFNGDGRVDVLYPRHVPGGATQPARVRFGGGKGPGDPFETSLESHAVPYRLLDLEGDGTTEVLAYQIRRTPDGKFDSDRSGYFLWRWSNLSQDFVRDDVGLKRGGLDYIPEYAPTYLDVDGDHYSDQLNFESYGSEYPDPDDCDQPHCWWLQRGGVPTENGIEFGDRVRTRVAGRLTSFAADIDGDGKTELLQNLGGGTMSYLDFDGGRMRSKQTNLGAQDHGGRGFEFIDINGDGLVDAVNPWSEDLYVHMNTGRGFGPLKVLVPAGEYVPPKYHDGSFGAYRGSHVADVDGNGLMDLVVIADSAIAPPGHVTIVAYLSMNGTMKQHILAVDGGQVVNGNFMFSRVADFDGDGMPELLRINGDSKIEIVGSSGAAAREGGILVPYRIKSVWSRPKLPPILLTGASLVGSNIELAHFYYASLKSGEAIYTAGSSCSHEQRCVTRPDVAVVSKMHTMTHRGDFSATEMRYQGLRSDRLSGATLGFETIVRSYPRKHTTIISHFDNQTRVSDRRGFALAKVPKETSTRIDLSEGTSRLQTETAPPRLHEFSNGTYAIRQSVRTERLREGPASTVATSAPLSMVWSEYAFDDYGNVTKLDVSVAAANRSEVSSLVVRKAYRNDPSRWIIGRPIEQRATSCRDGLCADRKSSATYDLATGALASTTLEPENPSLRLVTEYSHNAFGLTEAIEQTEAAGVTRAVTIEYDEFDIHPRKVSNPLGHSVHSWVHSGLGVGAMLEDENGVRVEMKYDGFGRPREVREQDGSWRRVSYRPAQELAAMAFTSATMTTSDGQLLRVEENVFGEPVRIANTAFDGREVREDYVYDEFGRPIQVSRPYFAETAPRYTVRTFDELDRVTSVVKPDGTEWSASYHRLFVDTRDEEGTWKSTELGADGLVESVSEPGILGPLTTEYRYAPFDQLREIEDPRGLMRSFSYDVLGRVTQQTDPDSGITGYTYDGFSRIKTMTTGAGTVAHDYDLLDRLVTRTAPEGTSSYSFDTAPNGIGMLDTARSADGVVTRFSYDALSRPTRKAWEIDGTSYQVGFTYDALGRLSKVAYPATAEAPTPLTIQQRFNEHGYLLAIHDDASGMPYWTLRERNPEGRGVREQLGSNLESFWSWNSDTGRLDAQNTTNGTGDVVQSLDYSYDNVGNLTSRINPDGRVEEFGYDFQYRLHTWTPDLDDTARVTTYDYDVLGNIVSIESDTVPEMTARYASTSNRMTSFNGQPVQLDGAGRVTSIAGTTLRFNSFDLPRQIRKDGDVFDFEYDAFDRRVMKRSMAANDYAQHITLDGIMERKLGGPDADSTAYFIMAEGRAVARIEHTAPTAPAEVSYLLHDSLGSVRTMTDAAGNEIESYDFSPFGHRISSTSPGIVGTVAYGGDQHLGFTGHQHDDDLGLVNMQGRMFDLATRRFLTPDPVIQDPTESQNLNAYNYVMNRPLYFVDPTGFEGEKTNAERNSQWIRDTHHSKWKGSYNPDNKPNTNKSSGPKKGDGDDAPVDEGVPGNSADSSGTSGTSADKHETGGGTEVPDEAFAQETLVEAEVVDVANLSQPVDGTGTINFASAGARATGETALALGKGIASLSGVGGTIVSAIELGQAVAAGDLPGAIGATIGLVPIPGGRFIGKAAGWTGRFLGKWAGKAGRWLGKKADKLFGKNSGRGAGRVWCFPAGTKVHTPEGLVDIEDVETGDDVLAYDDSIGEVVVRRVDDTSTSWTERLVEVELSGETIASTSGHPYWEKTTRRWLRADELRPGMMVRLRDGRAEEVRSVGERDGLTEVHNFEVADDHNYFVGESGVLVHNGGPESFGDFNQARNAALGWLQARGFKAERQVAGRFGPNAGKPIGMSSADGRVGFRVEFDGRSGAHINVWDHNAPKGSQKGPHFRFKGSEKTVNTIVRQFGC